MESASDVVSAHTINVYVKDMDIVADYSHNVGETMN